MVAAPFSSSIARLLTLDLRNRSAVASLIRHCDFATQVTRNCIRCVSSSYVGQAASNAQDQDFKANMTWRF
jgi:hypothetical protein